MDRKPGERILYTPQSREGMLPEGFTGMSSFSRAYVEKHFDESLRAQIHIVEQVVPCYTRSQILSMAGESVVPDLIQIDAEGYDFEVLKMIFAASLKPAILQFEHKHLDEQKEVAWTMLADAGYLLAICKFDTLAYHSQFAQRLLRTSVRAL